MLQSNQNTIFCFLEHSVELYLLSVLIIIMTLYKLSMNFFSVKLQLKAKKITISFLTYVHIFAFLTTFCYNSNGYVLNINCLLFFNRLYLIALLITRVKYSRYCLKILYKEFRVKIKK